MRDYEREPQAPYRERPSAQSWDAPIDAPLVPLTDRPSTTLQRSRYRLVVGVLALVAGALAGAAQVVALSGRPRPTPAGAPGVAAAWNVELASAGAEPVTALVFGREAGIHIMRVPAADAPLDARRRISAAVAAGDVYMVSLGRAELEVRSAAPSGATARVSLAARGRFVQIFGGPAGTGVRTSWR